jgi:proteasome accessory factor B
MFERDKDDLRSLGIEIEVGSFDPLFNDEAGYRIKQEKYQLDLGDVTSVELSLLSLAAEAWQDASFDDVAQKALLKLRSMGVPADELPIIGNLHKLNDGGQDLSQLSKAISQHQLLEFSYLDADMSTSSRSVVPIALSTRTGYWYLSAVDQDVQEVRTFRIDRIEGEIEVKKGPEDFEPPSDFDPKSSLVGTTSSEVAIIDVRIGKGSTLRALATSFTNNGEWDQLRVPIFNVRSLSSLVLWHGLDAYVQEPASLRDLIVEQLEALVKNHG